jgi:tetratricopeptide (TPR) repeat protein
MLRRTPAPVRVLVLCLVVVGAASTATAQAPQNAQAAGSASVQQRLNRVGTDLFSGSMRVEDAIRELKAILALEPGLAEAHLVLGVAYRLTGSPDLVGEVKAEFIQALTLKPDLVAARTYLAQLYLELGRAGSARETLEAGLGRQPGVPEFLGLLGETERQLGQPRRAVELTRQALQANESFAQGRYYLALALLDLGDREEGIKELQQVVGSGPTVGDAYLALGSAYIEAGRFGDATETLLQGTAVDPAGPEIRITLARAYRSRRLLTKADEQLNLAMPAVTAAQESPFSQHRLEPDFYLELGLVRMEQGRLRLAADAFQKAVDADSSNEPARRGLAEVRKLLKATPRSQKPGGKS